MELMLFDETKFNQAVKLAATLAKSTIVPKHFQGKAEDVFATLVMGAELGFQPMQALNSIVVIQGNVTLKAQTMLALVKSKCPKATITITIDEKNKAASCYAKRDDSCSGYTSNWDFNKAMDAKFAQSWDKDLKKWVVKHNWQVQPTNMAKWRAISETLRVIFPDIIQGVYATEEMEDLPPLRNDPLIDLQQAAREDAERMQEESLKPEEKIVGPLYKMLNGKWRGKHLKDLSFNEIEEYVADLKSRKTKKPWEVELLTNLNYYLTNRELFLEQLIELQEAE